MTTDKNGPDPAEQADSPHSPLLEDITMDLSIEIGRANVKISDLLNLTKGTIVHLDQPPDQPLSIYANGKMIAKGHIVSADGKYCVRIL